MFRLVPSHLMVKEITRKLFMWFFWKLNWERSSLKPNKFGMKLPEHPDNQRS